MNIVPTKNRVVVKKLKEHERLTESGIVLNSKKEKNSNQGNVISIGEEVTEVSVNDLIVYPNNVGIKIELEGETYIILKQDDILAIMN